MLPCAQTFVYTCTAASDNIHKASSDWSLYCDYTMTQSLWCHFAGRVVTIASRSLWTTKGSREWWNLYNVTTRCHQDPINNFHIRKVVITSIETNYIHNYTKVNVKENHEEEPEARKEEQEESLVVYRITGIVAEEKVHKFCKSGSIRKFFLALLTLAWIFIYETAWIAKVFSRTIAKKVIHETFLPQMIHGWSSLYGI